MTRSTPYFPALAVSVTALLFACSACTSMDSDAVVGANDKASGAPQRSIARYAQMSFGRDASFALCIEPACPKVTPKTIKVMPTSELTSTPVTPGSGAPSLLRTTRPRAVLSEPFGSNAAAVVPSRVVIHFSPGSADMTAEAKRAIAQALPRSKPPKRVVIAGFGDEKDRPKANDPLMLRRAMAVRSYLVKATPRLAAAVSIDALGSCCFGADQRSNNGKGQQKSGEIEIVFTSFGATE